MQVGVVGINHKLADLRLRELLAKACQKHFVPWNAVHNEHTFVLLSTCNRTEIYFTSPDLSLTHSYLLSIFRQEVVEEFDQKLYSYFGQDCFCHISRVTAGLDSAIVAETEIQGQVKAAYEAVTEYHALPAPLHFLFQKALQIGKRVRSKLLLGRGMPGIEHAIFQLGENLFPRPQEANILFVGASEINQKVIRFLQMKGCHALTLCNRSSRHAEEMATQHQLKILPWESLTTLWQYDWVIFGTKSAELLIRKEQLPAYPKLIIDLCVPRNVDPALAKELPLYNIDAINHTLLSRKQSMSEDLAAADSLIQQATARHTALFSERESRRLQFNPV